MPLKIHVKPEGRIFVGGTIIKNVGARPVDLLILSDTPVLRENYLKNFEKKDDSDTGNVYFLLQVLYLYKNKKKPLDKLVIKTIQNFGALYPDLQGVVDAILKHLEAGESFKALQIAHKLLEQSGEEPIFPKD
jgi:flagellar biosynthesis regulator FlbT